MEQRPFTAREQDGVLFLSLDTPGCAVNIFGNDAANQLLEILELAPLERLRAVVFRTGKRHSFINGVGLLMAMTSVSPQTAAELSAAVRRAYREVERLPVPTIAEIQGNCYGCGVEFALRCQHRVAVDTAVTHFYMTELNDYLFAPVFEATIRLPLLLGLEGAIDLLLWGQRWSVPEALSRGLIDERVEPDAMEAGFSAFLERVLRGEAPSPPPRAGEEDREVVLQRARQRIDRLPPSHQPLYRDCLEQMASALGEGRPTEDLIQRELELAGRSSATPQSKSALSFFFIRQSAQHASLQGIPLRHDGWRVSVEASSAATRALGAELERRRLSETSVAIGIDETADLVLVGAEAAPAGGAKATAVLLDLAELQVPTCDRILYGPFRPAPCRFLELATRQRPDPVAGELCAYLEAVGFKVVVTHPQQSLLLDRWVAAYLAPLVRYTLAGGSAGTVAVSLWSFGCTRGPAELLASLERAPLGRKLAAHCGLSPEETAAALSRLAAPGPGSTRADEEVIAGLCLSLLAEALVQLGAGELEHPALADLIAREVLDFPLQHGSMCQYLAPARARELLDAGPTARLLAGSPALATVESYASRKRPLVL